jgi:hypothetical protein
MRLRVDSSAAAGLENSAFCIAIRWSSCWLAGPVLTALSEGISSSAR